ncbi:MAG: PepSY domain-containing protein [Gemmatimonadaceae bacterium]|nr:PepSY domain-containing protein [Gemmatimonadaceae bacterium]
MLFWSHLTLGVAAGLVILLMSITGVLLGFERQTIAWLDGAPRVEVPAAGERQSIDALLAGADVAPAEVTSIALRADAAEPVTVRFRDRERGTLLLDPYRGGTVSPPTDSTGRKAMAALRRWHRWVGAEGGEWRERFKAVTGASNLAFLLIVLSGLWLWWPKRLTWTAVRNVLWFRRGLSPKARDFNWHNTIGFWSAIPLFFVVASGVFISYKWPGLWLDRVAGNAEERAAATEALASASEPAAGGTRRERTEPRSRDRVMDSASVVAPAHAPLQQFADAAMASVPAWQSLTITLPSVGDSVVSVAAAAGNTYRPDLRTTLRFDARTATPITTSGYDDLSVSRKIRAWVRFGHTGEVFGWTGQLVATLASLGGVFLVWTGLALSWRRLIAWWRRRRTPPPRVATQEPMAERTARAPQLVG